MIKRCGILFDQGPTMRRRVRDNATASVLRKQFAFAKKMRATDNKKQLRIKLQMEKALSALRDSHYDVGEDTMSVAISTLGKIGLQQTAEELFASTADIRKESKTRDPTLFNAVLICRILNTHYTNIADVVRNTFKEMKAEKLAADLITYNTALKGVQQILSKSNNDATYSKIALTLQNDILFKMKQGNFSPDTATFNILLSCSTPDTVLGILDDFKASGEEPSASSYYSMVSMYSRHGQFNMSEKWLIKSSKDRVITKISITSYMQGCSRSDLPASEKVERLLRAMQLAIDERIHPPLEAHHLIMDAYGKNYEFTKAARQYKLIVSQGLTPTYRTYTILINSVAVHLQTVRRSDYQKYVAIAEAAFLQGLQEGAINNKGPYEALARLYTISGNHQQAVATATKFINMKNFGRSEYLEGLLKERPQS